MSSIRSRLLIWQISALLLTGLVASLLTYQLALNGFKEVQDNGLEQIAHTVLRHDETPVPAPAGARPAPDTAGADSASTPDDNTIDEPDANEPDEGQFVSQVWSTKGQLIYSSALDDGPPLQAPGFHWVSWQDHLWRVFTLPRATRTAQVAVSMNERASIRSSLLMWLLLPMGLLVILLGLLIHEAVSRALRPLDHLSQEIGQREVAQLHALALEEQPEEVVPLVNTLNQLLSRLDRLLASQRQFLADAAHELNTPLAAIKLQAQLARRASDAERKAALDDLDVGIERAIHLASQLLQLARLEPDQRAPDREPVDLGALVRQTVATFSAQAEHQGHDLGLVHADSPVITGDPQALRAMLDNLIDNALRYTPAGTRVDISLRSSADSVLLEVADNGPGIPARDRPRALQRFVRLNRTDTTGSGLGMAIVEETVALHGGTVELADTPDGGLTVRIRLPMPAGVAR